MHLKNLREGKSKLKLIIPSIILIPLVMLSLQFIGNANISNGLRMKEQSGEQEAMQMISTDELDIADDLKLEKVGTASYYGPKFHARKTANGEIFDMNQVSAAHKKLPFGTILRVTNLRNGESVLTRINDRGPMYIIEKLIFPMKQQKKLTDLALPK